MNTKKIKQNINQTKLGIPVIDRHELMSILILDEISPDTKKVASSLYQDVIHKEVLDMHYITDIPVQSEQEVQLWNIINKLHSTNKIFSALNPSKNVIRVLKRRSYICKNLNRKIKMVD